MEKVYGVLSQDEPRYWNLFEFDSYGKCGVLILRVDPRGRDSQCRKGVVVQDRPAVIS